MNDDKDKKTPEEGEERTVFMPSIPDASGSGGTVPASGAEPPPGAEGGGEGAQKAEASGEGGTDIPLDSPFYIPPEPSGESTPAASDPVPPQAPPAAEPAAAETGAPVAPPPVEPSAAEKPTADADAPPTVPSDEVLQPASVGTNAPPPSEQSPADEPASTEPTSTGIPPDPPAAESPAAPEPSDEERTVIAPAGDAAPSPKAAAAPAEAGAAPPQSTATTLAGAIKAREGARPIKVGDVLNHIFEVKRFIGRGGMGEVFEGANVNTDERVAIKVMLPAMAADEKVVAMFRKEARTLTKLQHEALVQYRVLAQEPQLGVLYIVTEFIEGVELCDMLGKVERTPDELVGLLRRLASGLSAAHRLGAIHRDISPDNVLLEDGDIHKATIIDFGIAKDLDASSATIVGDGFAGKLNYVAPEQLGDFGRDIGPWTDVYSLALVILAVAQGKNVNMSGSLVDAIDKRRKGPDLSPVPSKIRGLLEDMLRPDPKDRLRSMDDVLARLGGAPPPPPPPPPSAAAGAVAGARSGTGTNRTVLIVLAALVVLLVIGGLAAWYMMREPDIEFVPVNEQEPAEKEEASPSDPEATARAAINSALPSVGCTWLDIGSIEASGNSVRVAMRGVAGDSRAAQQEISTALARAGLENATVGFGDVAPITPAGCAALDTYRQVRASSGYRMSVPQTRFEAEVRPAGAPKAGRLIADASLNFDFADASRDFALLAIEPSGAITMLIPNRAAFEAELRDSRGGRPITDLGNGRYRLNFDVNDEDLGWTGFILISGQGPFDRDLVAPSFGSRGPSWQGEFLSAASRGNWRVEMAWFESVNRD